MQHIPFRTLSAAALVLVVLGSGRAEAAAGSVVGILGQCVDESGGQRKPLHLGSPVEIGDVIEVPAAAKLKLRMSDGSILSIASGSKLTIGAYALDPKGKRQDAELQLGEGLLRAVVAPVNHPSTFEVKTATGTAAVRSTDWFIEAKATDTLVAVLSGVVTLTSGTTGHSVSIGPRHGADVDLVHDPSTPQSWKMSRFYALIARVEIPVRRPPRRRHSEEEEYYPGPNNLPPSEGPQPVQNIPPPNPGAPPPSGPGGFGSYPGGVFGAGPGGLGFPTRPGGGGFIPPPPPPPRQRGNFSN